MSNLSRELSEAKEKTEDTMHLLDSFKKYMYLDVLERTIVIELIDRIIVSKPVSQGNYNCPQEMRHKKLMDKL